MDKKTIKRLEEQKKQRTDALIQDLLKGDGLKNAREHMEWLKISAPLIDSLQSTGKYKLIWPITIGIVFLLIIGLAWTQRIQITQVSFEVVSPNVGLKLDEDWELGTSFVASRIFINNLDTVLAPEMDINFQRDIDNDQEPALLILTGQNIHLKEFWIPEEVTLSLTLEDSKLTFYSKGNPIRGKLEATDATFTLIEEDDEEIYETVKSMEDLETVRFISSKTKAHPVKIELNISDGAWEIRDFRSNALNFTKEYPPGSGEFESTVKSGKITLLETGAEEELRESDVFLLRDITTRRLELSKAEGGIKVFFEGSVSVIAAGPPGFEKNLAPTYLEYIYQQEKLAFFWSAVVFLWGLIWSFKNTLLGKNFNMK